MASLTTPLASPDDESHAAAHFEHVDLRSSTMLFLMPSVSHDPDANASGVT